MRWPACQKTTAPLGIRIVVTYAPPRSPHYALLSLFVHVPPLPLGFFDLLLVKERDGRLCFEAGLVTFAAAWSVSFDVGMTMDEIHNPVPRLTREGITSRAEQFLRRLPADQVYRRVNWTLSASGSRKLDVSLEELPAWGTDIPALVRDEDWGRLQLRIEVEHFVRLPMTGAVTFNIRTHMTSLDEIRRVPAWREQLARVVLELPEDLATYKGFADYREPAMAWLRREVSV